MSCTLLYCLVPGEHVKVPLKFADRKYDYVFFVVVFRKDDQFRLQDCRDHKKMQSFSGGKCMKIFSKTAPKEIIWQVFAANNWSHISWPQSCRKAFADSFAYNIGSHSATFFLPPAVFWTTRATPHVKLDTCQPGSEVKVQRGGCEMEIKPEDTRTINKVR